jgi:hypothetical protein
VVDSIACVNTAFEVTVYRNATTLYKFVPTRIIGETRTVIDRRNLGELREFLKSTYTEKRTLDYHPNQLFSTKQTKGESVSDWIQRIQKLGGKFREAALQEERPGILSLSDRLKNICFVQDLYSDRIQNNCKESKSRQLRRDSGDRFGREKYYNFKYWVVQRFKHDFG